ncbi:N-formylglutamate deformylase [Novosphingobium lentum]|uniref:N-formylglutamate deformylase n=1 Tax=Novosphingobium lentum TaxID=145287 RepID=UPI000835398B|nr:N-formylglutamate deformylase [Novosphingobium lentum]
MTDWLSVASGAAPLIVSIPHAGTIIPDDIAGLRSLELARRDADHHVDRLYAFAAELGATIVHSRISRTVIDLNRDPSGQSLYPGQATTGLCPVSTFDGEPLYTDGAEPDAAEIERRRSVWFEPYHAALGEQIARLRALHPAIVLYDGHSIRSHVPRLFDGELPQFNIGSYDGASCAVALTEAIAADCADDSHVVNGRFKGGWITRRYGDPARGIHAVQMELAIRGYADEVGAWPPPWDAERAVPMQAKLRSILTACLDFAKGQP